MVLYIQVEESSTFKNWIFLDFRPLQLQDDM